MRSRLCRRRRSTDNAEASPCLKKRISCTKLGCLRLKPHSEDKKFTQATRVHLLAKRAVQKQEEELLDEEKLSDSTQIYLPCGKLLKTYNFYFS